MSNLALFMKRNQIAKENTFFAATQSLKDEEGNPLMWEIRPLTPKEEERIKELCTNEVPVKGRPHLTIPKLNTSKYISKMLAASVVTPDLLNAELQDSYGVKNEEDLLKEMIDSPGEYNDFGMFVQRFNGFNIAIEDKADEVKNE
jgi:hypothetical protein